MYIHKRILWEDQREQVCYIANIALQMPLYVAWHGVRKLIVSNEIRWRIQVNIANSMKHLCRLSSDIILLEIKELVMTCVLK